MRIGIVGAGITGTMTAWYLASVGHRVQLFDQRSPTDRNIASYTAAGMLAPYAELECSQAVLYEMGVASLDEWAVLAATLKQDFGYVQNGTLMLAHAQDRAEYQRVEQTLMRHQLFSTEHVQSLNQNSVAALEPELAERFESGLFFPREGRVDVIKTLQLLQTEIEQAGGSFDFNAQVQGISPGNIQLSDQSHAFDWVIDCRGLCARDVIPTLRGVRGELLLLEAPDVCIDRLIRLLHPRYRLYIAPQENHRYIVGASQIETNDLSPISVRSTLELLSAAVSVHAGFAEARILETRVNCRPTLPDNEPRIHHQPGLLRVNGLYRHGYLLSPLVAREVTNLIASADNYQCKFPSLIEYSAEAA